MTSSEVDRLERYLDSRFDRLEENVNSINERVMQLEKSVATLRAFAVFAVSVGIILAATGIIRGVQYLAQ